MPTKLAVRLLTSIYGAFLSLGVYLFWGTLARPQYHLKFPPLGIDLLGIIPIIAMSGICLLLALKMQVKNIVRHTVCVAIIVVGLSLLIFIVQYIGHIESPLVLLWQNNIIQGLGLWPPLIMGTFFSSIFFAETNVKLSYFFVRASSIIGISVFVTDLVGGCVIILNFHTPGYFGGGGTNDALNSIVLATLITALVTFYINKKLSSNNVSELKD